MRGSTLAAIGVSLTDKLDRLLMHGLPPRCFRYGVDRVDHRGRRADGHLLAETAAGVGHDDPNPLRRNA
jgi:hypothetical protein